MMTRILTFLHNLVTVTIFLGTTSSAQLLKTRESPQGRERLAKARILSVTEIKFEYRFGQLSQNGERVAVAVFDSSGNRMTDVAYGGGRQQSLVSAYRYDTLQRLIEVSQEFRYYNGDSMFEREEYRYADGKVDFIKYGRGGKVSKKTTFDCDSLGYVIVHRDSSNWEIKRDHNGNILEMTYSGWHDGLRDPRRKVSYKYTDSGRLVESRDTTFTLEFEASSVITYRYDLFGNVIEKEEASGRYSGGWRESYKYDQQGLGIEALKYDENNEPTELRRFIYQHR